MNVILRGVRIAKGECVAREKRRTLADGGQSTCIIKMLIIRTLSLSSEVITRSYRLDPLPTVITVSYKLNLMPTEPEFAWSVPFPHLHVGGVRSHGFRKTHIVYSLSHVDPSN